jgi:hypothetical protein
MPRLIAPENQTPDYDAKVAAGAQYLDGRRLSHTTRWRNYIDTARLDMGDIHRDLLAQLDTTFEALDLTLDEAIAYGFEPAIDNRDHHAALTNAWRRLLTDEIAEVA